MLKMPDSPEGSILVPADMLVPWSASSQGSPKFKANRNVMVACAWVNTKICSPAADKRKLPLLVHSGPAVEPELHVTTAPIGKPPGCGAVYVKTPSLLLSCEFRVLQPLSVKCTCSPARRGAMLLPLPRNAKAMVSGLSELKPTRTMSPGASCALVTDNDDALEIAIGDSVV
jgi:hypothetical protein